MQFAATVTIAGLGAISTVIILKKTYEFLSKSMSGGNQTTPPLPQLEYGKVEEITEETTEEITTEETIEETTDLYKLTESSSTSESPDSSLSDSGFKDAEAPSTSESPDSST